MTSEDLAQLLHDARVAARISQDRLGRAIGHCERTIRAWESCRGLDSLADYLTALEFCGCRIVVKHCNRQDSAAPDLTPT